MWSFLCLSALLLSPSPAADRPQLTGTWVLDPAHSQMHESKVKSEKMEIQQIEDVVQVTDSANADGKDRKLEYKCLADGSTCKTKDVSISLYYDGPMLVVLEMQRKNTIVIKKRLQTSADGKTLSMDVIHVSPPGPKDEVLTFVKQ
jgi:hypothetical protein